MNYQNETDSEIRELIPSQRSEVLTIEEAAEWLRIGRTKMCQLLSTGEVGSVVIGRRRLVPLECLRTYVADLLTNPYDQTAA